MAYGYADDYIHADGYGLSLDTDLPRLPTPHTIDSWMFEAIRKTPVSNGLAILIGCTTSFNHKEKLCGVVKDLRKLISTFEQLMFTTLCLDDPSVEIIRGVIDYTSKLNEDSIMLPNSWRRIVVTFSGHGTDKYLLAKNGEIDLRQDIVLPLQALKARELACIPKLFFIDACRGDKEDTGVFIDNALVPRGFVARGGRTVPSEGNYFIAYSTLLGMKAFEDGLHGGLWMQLLSNELVSSENIDKDISVIATIVNKKIAEIDSVVQQPVSRSTMRDEVHLLREAIGTGYSNKGSGFILILCVCTWQIYDVNNSNNNNSNL